MTDGAMALATLNTWRGQTAQLKLTILPFTPLKQNPSLIKCSTILLKICQNVTLLPSTKQKRGSAVHKLPGWRGPV